MAAKGKAAENSETLVQEKEAAFSCFIQERGLKTTRQRQSIVRIFFGLRRHVSVEELLQEVKQEYPRIGYATVYRTLHLLVESGLAAVRRFGDGLARYEGRSEVEHHDHMICTECGHIFEFFSPHLERLQEKLADEHDFQIFRHRLELYGVCRDQEACDSRRQANPAANVAGRHTGQ
ncbi:MAG: transcriptional repressor [bacterium]